MTRGAATAASAVLMALAVVAGAAAADTASADRERAGSRLDRGRLRQLREPAARTGDAGPTA